jgi:electron transfer flavoprotein alpha subunit
MNDIHVLIEHRQGAIRDISYEILAAGRKLAAQSQGKLTAVLCGHQAGAFAEKIKTQADRLVVMDSELFKNFNAEIYQMVLAELIKQEKPLLVLLGHSASGMDIGPSLAVQLNMPFATDCCDLQIDNAGGTASVSVTRTMYDGKLNAKVRLRQHGSYLVTLRSGCFPAEEGKRNAEISSFTPSLKTEPEYRRFVEYIEAALGEVDITKSDIVIGIGRGIKEQANLALIEDFAKTVGGVVACSRPIVDNGWMPKDRQVGSSGKTIKPKLYIALGISGAFQHLVGMKSSDLIIAVNKDPNAPIFNEADYGIVDDLFKVVPVLKNKIVEVKQAKA